MVVGVSLSGYLSKYRSFALCATLLILNLLLSYLFSWAFPNAFAGHFEPDDSLLYNFFLVVVFAPLIETYFFQKLLIGWLSRWTKNEAIAVLVAALLFGSQHFYSLPYMAKTFISGAMYNILYLTIDKKGQPAFWIVCASHSAFNLIAFCAYVIEKL